MCDGGSRPLVCYTQWRLHADPEVRPADFGSRGFSCSRMPAMPAHPWVTLRQPEAGREYLALLSELPLKFTGLPKFFASVGRIDEQLRKTSGLMGYSMLARPLRMKFWTLSVWESDASLT